MHTHTHPSTPDRQTKAGQGTLSHLDESLSTRRVKHLNHQSLSDERDTVTQMSGYMNTENGTPVWVLHVHEPAVTFNLLAAQGLS